MESWMGTVVYFIFILGIFYLVLIRPQQKRQKQHRELLESLKVNDDVVTAGGIFGTITRVKDNSVWLKVADKVEIEVLKSAVSSVQGTEKK
ncbi:preprotein translocase subunit YajC [Dehalobacterium formicoaceticum]|uniref:Preprotein translocase subunit YajC n=1 Tax=Dehalobacterium formicoaceticum TaxID=51515 RepID=A0ABT1Y7D2_9FIRM|nr:preprotein translocase subunit YajC [Dehalobacterium formicoaceticum]MCR6546800.1 preprotein translocase subunit YajC [Dehalobacterium formicoaceticum]